MQIVQNKQHSRTGHIHDRDDLSFRPAVSAFAKEIGPGKRDQRPVPLHAAFSEQKQQRKGKKDLMDDLRLIIGTEQNCRNDTHAFPLNIQILFTIPMNIGIPVFVSRIA